MASDNANAKNNAKNWDASRKEIAKSSEALVDVVTNYQPSKQSIRNKKGPKPYQELAETASLFFRTAADVLDGKYQPAPANGPLNALQNFLGQAQTDLTNTTQDTLDKAGKTLDKTNKKFGKFWQKTSHDVQETIKDAHLDKKVAEAADNVGKAVTGAVDNIGKTAAEVGDNIGKTAGDAADNVGKTIKNAKIDKKLADAADNIGKTAADAADNLGKAVKNAKIDKKLAQAVDNATDNVGKTVKDAKLDKKLAATLKNSKLDEKFDDAVENVGKAFKNAKLDEKFDDAVDNVGKAVKNAKIDKKLAKARKQVEKTVKNAKLDEKLAKTVKDAKLDKKFNAARASLTDSLEDLEIDKKASGLLATVGTTFEHLADNLGEALKEAHLDKKFANVSETVGDFIKEAHLDKKFADVTDNLGEALKEAHLDKKLAGVTETFEQLTGNLEHAIKDAKLDKKFASVSDKVGETFEQLTGNVEHAIKDAKLDKKFANVSDNVRHEVDKLGGEVKKKQAKALKEAKKQQRKLGKEAGKLLEEQRDNLLNAANSLPFVNIELPKKKNHTFRNLSLGVGAAGAVIGGLAANNARIWNSVPTLESKLPGESRYFRSKRGIVFYKEAGSAEKTPVVFVHGIGAGNHSYEWLSNFEAFSKQHKVYAFDLFGFGNSERRDIVYTAELYIEQLMDFLDEVVKRPAYIVASSLASAYAIQVAYRRPELVSRLVLVSPTGINKAGGKQKIGFLPENAYSLLRVPVLDKAIYDMVASHNGIRTFMEQHMFFDKSKVKSAMVEQYYIAAHQPGAQYAPPSFFTGKLDASLQEVSKIKQPVLAIAGKNSHLTSPQELEALQKLRPGLRLEMLDQARLSVQWEYPERFNSLALDFLAENQAEDETRLRPEPALAADNRTRPQNISHLTRQAAPEPQTNSDESDRPEDPDGDERKALG